jgi:hypothetical protein
MVTPIQDSVCKTVSALGFPKRQTRLIVNSVMKTIQSNGIEEFIKREKAIKHWYCTYLSGEPEPPKGMAHRKDGTPKSAVLRYLFKQQNQAKALAALSIGTVFINTAPRLTRAQCEKALGSWIPWRDIPTNLSHESIRDFTTREMSEKEEWRNWHPWSDYDHLRFRNRIQRLLTAKTIKPKLPRELFEVLNPESLNPPSSSYYTKSCPFPKEGELSSCRAGNANTQRKILYEDQKAMPKYLAEWLDEMGRPDLVPESLWEGLQSFGPIRSDGLCEVAGIIRFIQEEQFKLRMIGNPRRILQNYLEPLTTFLTWLSDSLPFTVTRDQESGTLWAQSKLREGVTLASSDLTAASDRLSLEGSWNLVQATLLYDLSEPQASLLNDHFRLMRAVSRAPWQVDLSRLSPSQEVDPRTPDLTTVKWVQGWCLGTRPSFSLLSLVNCCCAINGFLDFRDDNPGQVTFSLEDSFRVLGDDIVMRAEIEPYYNRYISELGGEINESKTLKSNAIAEFAGRIVTAKRIMNKSLKLRPRATVYDVFKYVDNLGLQAVGLLNRKQRRLFQEFKYVPGVVRNGPWSQHSYGQSLSDRVLWSETVLPHVEPDPDEVVETLEENLHKQVIQSEFPTQKGQSSSKIDDERIDQPTLGSRIKERLKSLIDPGSPPSIDVGSSQFGTDSEKSAIPDPTLGTPPKDVRVKVPVGGDPRKTELGPDEYLKAIKESRKHQISKETEAKWPIDEPYYQKPMGAFVPFKEFKEASSTPTDQDTSIRDADLLTAYAEKLKCTIPDKVKEYITTDVTSVSGMLQSTQVREALGDALHNLGCDAVGIEVILSHPELYLSDRQESNETEVKVENPDLPPGT